MVILVAALQLAMVSIPGNDISRLSCLLNDVSDEGLDCLLNLKASSGYTYMQGHQRPKAQCQSALVRVLQHAPEGEFFFCTSITK